MPRRNFLLRAGRVSIFLALSIWARGDPDVEDTAILDGMGAEVNIGGGVLIPDARWPRWLPCGERPWWPSFRILRMCGCAGVSACFPTRVPFSPQNRVPRFAVRDLVVHYYCSTCISSVREFGSNNGHTRIRDHLNREKMGRPPTDNRQTVTVVLSCYYRYSTRLATS